MSLSERLRHLERLVRLRQPAEDWAGLFEAAGYAPGQPPPVLPEDHPARPLRDLLMAMDLSVMGRVPRVRLTARGTAQEQKGG